VTVDEDDTPEARLGEREGDIPDHGYEVGTVK
jgi:hypothetical protein